MTTTACVAHEVLMITIVGMSIGSLHLILITDGSLWEETISVNEPFVPFRIALNWHLPED